MKKIKFISFVLSFITLVLLSSCKKENACDCIKRTGDIVVETRYVKGFTRIEVEDNLNVFITQAPDFEVKVEAGENIVPLIETELKGDYLILRNKNRCNWTRSYDKPFNVYIKMPVIKYLSSNSTGKMISSNILVTPEFDVEVKNSGDIELYVNNTKVVSHVFGSGDLILHGKTGEHSCSIGGTSFLYCTDLQTSYTWVHSFTTGLCYVKAKDLFVCSIDQLGDIYCYGHPASVQQSINAEGRLYLE